MSRCPKNNFQLSIMSKCPAKHICTKVSFKITIRRRHVYIDIRCIEYETSISFWEFEMLSVVLPSFQLPTRLNSRTQRKLNLLMNCDTLICIWILVFPFGIIEFTTQRICSFRLYFSSLHDYWNSTTWNSLVLISLGEMEWCEKRAFQLLKMRKKIISLNIKTKFLTEFLLTVSSTRMKDDTSHYGVST